MLAATVYGIQCRRLADMLHDHLPASAGPKTVLAWCSIGRRSWFVSNKVTERDIVRALNEVAGLYPGWIAEHRLYSIGLGSKWGLTLYRLSDRSIDPGRLPDASIRRIPIGLDLFGVVVSIAADMHTLVVAVSGWGKSNLLSVMIRQLTPPAKAGICELDIIDLKNGMEASMYGGDKHQVFARQAWTLEEAVRLLTDLVGECDRRAELSRGRTRMLEPSKTHPRIYLFIDEAAQLHSGGDKKLSDEATRLLDSLLRRGRAVGIVVISFTQNPRVSSMPLRAGFPQRVALHLNDETESRMLMGDECVEHGAAPWRLTLPGSGYAWNPERGEAQYFRTPLITDAEISAFNTDSDTSEREPEHP
ncbi:FtsK/SpoIIIE domain-containing protein [Bifidobacterium miconisargentati]|uniref:FtsK/SpoIIIE domain-containing protein n=1 Tax=Bifidobacterium miconisargentati TaxID=2834437 RepID=UPI001BDD3392|nr:FtsK/SpoIIIE domain-containing protein [Bifidobacterium miconisargentati]MBW3091336.1 cell division protein FtsK [Bifidobacterium miconisargentati]